jgi:hypothetical protein
MNSLFETTKIRLASLARATLVGALAGGLWAGAAHAAITVYQGPSGLAAFNALPGAPGTGLDFEALSGDIAGVAVNGVTFSSPTGTPLLVVDGASTFTPPGFGAPNPATNRLFPTSGLKVLSPGGLELAPGPAAVQRDSLIIDFSAPLAAFGLDILFQSLDAGAFVNYELFDASLTSLGSGSVSTAAVGGQGNDPGGAFFFGVRLDSPNLGRVVFTELDDNASFPDSNIGFDTLRFAAPASAAPEPTGWAMLIMGFGLAGTAMRRRRLARA